MMWWLRQKKKKNNGTQVAYPIRGMAFRRPEGFQLQPNGKLPVVATGVSSAPLAGSHWTAQGYLRKK